MALQKADSEGNLWFFSDKDSSKNHEILHDNSVQLLFQSANTTDYLSVYGNAAITTDKQKIEELWDPIAKIWFNEGKDDPRISVIKVAVSEGYYWDTKHGKIVALLKMAAGAITGQTFDDSIEGKMSA